MDRTTRTLLLILLAAAGTADAALGASRLVIRGAGFGHGVGMSQYGAYGFAKRGKDHRFILAYYYRGTKLSTLASDPTVRVLLRTGETSFSGATRAAGRRLSAGRTYRAAPTGLGRVALRSAKGRTLATFASPMRVTGPGPIRVNGTAQNGITNGRYRGAMEFKSTALGFLAVNAVGLEDYVSGVVSAESPPSWPAEALRAQAIAARTYAITTGGGTDYDQFADTRSQMYVGVGGEFASTEAAIDATRGVVVTYAGKPVVTYFFSTSGGRTESVENSFVGSDPKPWLKSVPDPYDNESPRYRWNMAPMELSAATAKLHGYVKGSFRGIDVVRRGESPRVVYADVVGTRGRTRVTGALLRARFGLYDTWATFNVITASGEVRNPDGAESAPEPDEASGGISPGAARAASTGRTLRGRVGWTERPTRVAIQRRAGGRWATLYEIVTDRRGRFAVHDLDRGTYRVRWRGAAGTPVAL